MAIYCKPSKWFKVIPRLLAITAAAAMSCSTLSCSPKETPVSLETITIGTIAWEPSALIYIAEDQEYFKANGLIVVINDYETGLATTDAMLSGEVDIAACAEYIVVERAFEKKNILTLATIANSENELIIGRIDKGIRTTADLKGKKIGLPQNTVADFYFGRFLELNGMTRKDVSIVDFLPSALGDALANGSVDAVVAWQAYAYQIIRQQGDFTVSWPVQMSQPMFWNIACSPAFIAEHEPLVDRFIASLAQAQKYLAGYPEKSKSIIQKKLNYDDSYISAVWSETQYLLSLNKSLIVAMEDEARWMIDNELTTENTIPDFMKNVYENALKAIKPEAVNIIR
jgi:ABC-type nitrate/sulfonate/bicarbonate transport system substrate-binding protein